MSYYNLPVPYTLLNANERREVREQYMREQKGLCYHCKCSLSEEPPASITIQKLNMKLFPDNFLKYPVHLQHDHMTGLTEGAVHAYCNAVLWQYHGR